MRVRSPSYTPFCPFPRWHSASSVFVFHHRTSGGGPLGSHPPSLLVVLSVSLMVRRLMVDRWGQAHSLHHRCRPRTLPPQYSGLCLPLRKGWQLLDGRGLVLLEEGYQSFRRGGEPQERQREPRGVTKDGYPRVLLHSSDGENRKLTMHFASAE